MHTVIISYAHRYIFFAVPKTATHAIRQALRQHLGSSDLEQVGLFVEKRFPFPELSRLRHGHISVRQIKPVLGEALFAQQYKFAFVRNPFDRFVSYCAFISRNSGDFQRAPRHYMKHVIHELRPTRHLLFRPQHELLVDEGGALAMDFLGRVEHLQRDFDVVMSHLALPSATLGHVNGSAHGAYRDYYDDDLAEAVRRYYRSDFELFAYPLEP